MKVIKVEDLTDIDIIDDGETVDIRMCASIIDAVPVVRCKDCKWFADSVPHWELPLLMMNHVCTKWGRGCRTDLDGFCFMGERKADE